MKYQILFYRKKKITIILSFAEFAQGVIKDKSFQLGRGKVGKSGNDLFLNGIYKYVITYQFIVISLDSQLA